MYCIICGGYFINRELMKLVLGSPYKGDEMSGMGLRAWKQDTSWKRCFFQGTNQQGFPSSVSFLDKGTEMWIFLQPSQSTWQSILILASDESSVDQMGLLLSLFLLFPSKLCTFLMKESIC